MITSSYHLTRFALLMGGVSLVMLTTAHPAHADRAACAMSISSRVSAPVVLTDNPTNETRVAALTTPAVRNVRPLAAPTPPSATRPTTGTTTGTSNAGRTTTGNTAGSTAARGADPIASSPAYQRLLTDYQLGNITREEYNARLTTMREAAGQTPTTPNTQRNLAQNPDNPNLLIAEGGIPGTASNEIGPPSLSEDGQWLRYPDGSWTGAQEGPPADPEPPGWWFPSRAERTAEIAYEDFYDDSGSDYYVTRQRTEENLDFLDSAPEGLAAAVLQVNQDPRFAPIVERMEVAQDAARNIMEKIERGEIDMRTMTVNDFEKLTMTEMGRLAAERGIDTTITISDELAQSYREAINTEVRLADIRNNNEPYEYGDYENGFEAGFTPDPRGNNPMTQNESNHFMDANGDTEGWRGSDDDAFMNANFDLQGRGDWFGDGWDDNWASNWSGNGSWDVAGGEEDYTGAGRISSGGRAIGFVQIFPMVEDFGQNSGTAGFDYWMSGTYGGLTFEQGDVVYLGPARYLWDDGYGGIGQISGVMGGSGMMVDGTWGGGDVVFDDFFGNDGMVFGNGWGSFGGYTPSNSYTIGFSNSYDVDLSAAGAREVGDMSGLGMPATGTGGAVRGGCLGRGTLCFLDEYEPN